MIMEVGVALSSATLKDVGTSVAKPRYDRGDVRVGIVHFGVGGFHRSHQAMYLDRLMNAGGALEWGICGVGVMPSDARIAEVLAAQDGLYTLMIKRADGRIEPRIIGSIVRYLYAPDDPAAVLEVLAREETRIVSLTITEGGYNVDPDTGRFDAGNPAVQADLTSGRDPLTVFGLVVEALRRRRVGGIPPFTVMSCDNLEGNGTAARRAFSSFAALVDPDLGEWVRNSVSYPNSMVDRITPVTDAVEGAVLLEQFGVRDGWPVVSEAFTQWVLEDDFRTGRPAWEDAGVQIVSEVRPYELMKLRLLNASHQAMCYLGYLAGYRFAHETASDPAFIEFLRGYMDEEGGPTLDEVPGVDLEVYKATLLARFANPEVRDTLARLCADSSDRIPKWLVPVIRTNLATGGEIRRSATVIASWARYDEGVDEQGGAIDVVDRLSAQLVRRARRERDEPLAFLRNEELFGDLVDDHRFRAAYAEARASLHQVGARETLNALNETLRRESES
jgi:mannitol 2-dehydrogenase